VRRLGGNSFVCLDECHHGGEDLSWGDSAVTAFEQAGLRLGLTGTPYRHDKAPIPWVRYEPGMRDGPGVVIPQYHYRYGDGLRDTIVAPIDFRWIGGSVTRTDHDGTELVMDFEDDYATADGVPIPEGVRERLMNARLNAAMRTDNPMLLGLDGLVDQVVDALAEARKTFASAGAAIICESMPQLREIYESLKARGLVVSYTTHKEASHDNVVADFNTGRGDVLLSIRQLAEGVSIPRLQVLGLAMCVTTQLFFTQVVGRLARLVEGLPYALQAGTVVAFADQRFIEYAEAFKNPDLDVSHKRRSVRKDKQCPNCGHTVALGTKKCPACGYEWDTRPPTPGFDYDGEVGDVFMTIDGKTYTTEEVAAFEEEMGTGDEPVTDDPWFNSLPRERRLRMFIKAREAVSRKGART
jgi:superfamily II DNA or RNA helicase